MSISDVVPDYSEQENVDPSSDKNEEKMSSIGNGNLRIKLLKPTRRFGQPNVTMAGSNYSSGARWVVIDVDLQDPPELIKEMWLMMNEGFEVVYATRLNCDGETVIKKVITKISFKVINGQSKVQIPRDIGKFKTTPRMVIDELVGLQENPDFLGKLAMFIGSNRVAIEYDRVQRYSVK